MGKILKGGYIVNGTSMYKSDVRIEKEIITEIGLNLYSENDEIYDVSDKILFPGFIDSHTHFDLEVSAGITADNFNTGTKAAITGGTTCILDFATQNKGETLNVALDNWHKKAESKSSCDYGFHMAISDWNDNVKKEIDDMIREGIPSFKLYMTYDAMYLDDKKILGVLKKIKEVNGLVGVHCENKGIIDFLINCCRERDDLKPVNHYLTRPDIAEAEAVNRLIYLASVTGTKITIVHLSSKKAYEEILRAKDKGIEVYVETCPQYLVLNNDKYINDKQQCLNYCIAPPLRDKEDSEALWNALLKEDIQFIGTDHCSFTTEQKMQGINDFTLVPCGMPGVELRPSLIFTYGVLQRKMTYSQMCRLLSENVAKIYGLYPRKGCISVGSDADIVVWNPDISWISTKNNQVSVADYNPYDGTELYGAPDTVFLRGEVVCEKGVVKKENMGKFIPRFYKQ